MREYLDKRFGWLFDPAEPALVTNSLQFMKQMLVGGRYLAITSQLDALSELEEGTLRFVPLTDKGLRPQSISVAIDARRPLSRAARLVGEALADTLSTRLEAV